MADDFERAVLICFNSAGPVGPDLKDQADAYLAGLKQSADVWKPCVERFSASAYQEVKFWCLQTLLEVVRACYLQLDANARGTVKAALLMWLQRDCTAEQPPLPAFLRNKLAQVLVAVVQVEYPDVWPTFFHDLVGAAARGPALADMYARIMAAVDEDVISLDIPRSQEEAKLSMRVKDAMREASIGEVVEAFYALTQQYRGSDAQLAAALLSALARYINWIDIGLVANEQFMALLLQLLEAPSPPLRGAATDCVVEILSKRMEPLGKLALVQQLKIVPAIASWAGSFPPGHANGAAGASEAEFEALMVKYVRLLAVLASEVMEVIKRVENSMISFTAMGFDVTEDAHSDASAAAEAATKLLDQLLPAVLKAFRSGRGEVSMPLVPFVLAYVARMKMLVKRSQALPNDAQLHLHALLEGVAANARFPDDSANDVFSGMEGVPPALSSESAAGGVGGKGAVPEADEQLAQEEQAEVEERRRELYVVFKNIAKLDFGGTHAFVARLLQSALSAPDASFQDVEVALALVYELGEGAPEEALKPPSGALAQLALAAVAPPGGLPHAHHRLVSLSLLECCVRYVRVLQQTPGAVPQVLGAFLDRRGLAHPCADVATRACYLFARISKQLRPQLRPYLGLMMPSLEPRLAAVATVPPVGGDASGTRGVDATGKALGSAVNPVVDDRLYVFEAVGLLLGQEDLGADEQLAALQSLLQPLMAQVESHLAAAAAAAAAGADGGRGGGGGGGVAVGGGGARGVPPAWTIMQAMEAMARLSKGFRPDLVTRTRPQLGALLVQSLQVATRVPQALPGSKQLRSRFIAFLHRMVECVLAAALPCLPAALEVLMQANSDAVDTTDVLSLLSQLTTRFKDSLAPLLQQLLPVLVARAHAHLGNDWDWSGKLAAPQLAQQQQQQQQHAAAASTSVAATLEEARERGELQRAYYSLLHTITHAGLSGVLLQAPPAALDVVMADLTRGAATHVDPGVRRLCLQVFEKLLAEWCANGEVVPGFRRYAMEQLGGEACVLGVLRGAAGLDARDAATVTLLGEVATALKLLYEKCGDEFAEHLCGAVLPSLGVPSEVQAQLVGHLRGSDAKRLKECLREVLLATNNASGGGRAPK